MDLNGNGRIDDGSELFGDGTFLAEGIQAAHGFEALARYDLPGRGGNADGLINREDQVWGRLLLWIDQHHDALTQRGEMQALERFGVVALELEYVETKEFDSHGNWHRWRSYFHKRVRWNKRDYTRRQLMEDIIFQVIDQ